MYDMMDFSHFKVIEKNSSDSPQSHKFVGNLYNRHIFMFSSFCHNFCPNSIAETFIEEKKKKKKEMYLERKQALLHAEILQLLKNGVQYSQPFIFYEKMILKNYIASMLSLRGRSKLLFAESWFLSLKCRNEICCCCILKFYLHWHLSRNCHISNYQGNLQLKLQQPWLHIFSA